MVVSRTRVSVWRIGCLVLYACGKMSIDTVLHKCMYLHIWSLLHARQVFALSPDHPVWRRERLPHHGGAQRIHPDMQVVVRYSQAFSQTCEQCETAGAQGNSRWCSSGTVYHSSSTFLPHQPRCRRPSISAPLYKKRKIKTDQEEQPTAHNQLINWFHAAIVPHTWLTKCTLKHHQQTSVHL